MGTVTDRTIKCPVVRIGRVCVRVRARVRVCIYLRMCACVCECAYVCVRACVRVRLCVCPSVRACVRACVRVRACICVRALARPPPARARACGYLHSHFISCRQDRESHKALNVTIA